MFHALPLNFYQSKYTNVQTGAFELPTLGRLEMCFGIGMKRTATARHYLSVGTAAKVSRKIMKSPSLLDWYFILRAHHQWTMFQAIRYALWLAR
jgi:hypothetical protein